MNLLNCFNKLFQRLIVAVVLQFTSVISWGIPVIQHWVLENGARVYFTATHELPMVDIKVLFAAGSAYDDNKRPGLAALTNSLLDQGAGKWDADSFAVELARIGGYLSTATHLDTGGVTMRTLAERAALEQAADLLAATLQNPTFPPDACARNRSQTLTALEAAQQSPDAVASKAFYRAIYGQHPYGRPILGDAASVARLEREDMIDFHRNFYVGRNAVLAIVGDLDRSGAEDLAGRVLGKLPPGTPPPPLPPVMEIEPLQEKITFPSSQTHILSGQPGFWRGDADYFPLYLGNHILGGSGLISRIADEIREKHALSYSAYSELIALRVAGPFIMGLQTRHDQFVAAYELLKKILAQFVAEGPTQEELIKAQQNITGGFALRLNSNRKILDYLALIGFYNLPLDYLERFNERIMAVTVEQIRSAFQRRIHPERLATVIIGKF